MLLPLLFVVTRLLMCLLRWPSSARSALQQSPRLTQALLCHSHRSVLVPLVEEDLWMAAQAQAHSCQ